MKLLPAASASATTFLGGLAVSLGVAALVDLVQSLASDGAAGFGVIAVAAVVILALLGLGGLTFTFGIRCLWKRVRGQQERTGSSNG
jgi:hypothetical protein